MAAVAVVASEEEGVQMLCCVFGCEEAVRVAKPQEKPQAQRQRQLLFHEVLRWLWFV